MALTTLTTPNGTPVSYIGSSEDIPLPGIFYFAISAKDSLSLDPFNQPALAVSALPLRIYSIDLTDHEDDKSPHTAMQAWADRIASGENFVSSFVDRVQEVIDFLVQIGLLKKDKIGLMGLSRGGFIAAHIAAALPYIQSIVYFAPVTEITHVQEFNPLQENPLALSLNLSHLTEKLYAKNMFFFIGNNDTRVSTHKCIHFFELLTQKATENSIRSPSIQMSITPSIGRFGHGTSPHNFTSGAHWLADQLIGE